MSQFDGLRRVKVKELLSSAYQERILILYVRKRPKRIFVFVKDMGCDISISLDVSGQGMHYCNCIMHHKEHFPWISWMRDQNRYLCFHVAAAALHLGHPELLLPYLT